MLALLVVPALAAQAGPSSFSMAARTGPWHGCVFEDGFAPYPIVLTPRGEDFFVSYPELHCIGGHNASLKPDGYDAVEVIIVNPDQRCATNLPLQYTIQPDSLRIDYFGGEDGTYALLRPSLPGATPPACDKAEAVS